MRKAHLNALLACLATSLLCGSCKCSKYDPPAEDYDPNPPGRLGSHNEAVTVKSIEDEIQGIRYEFLRRKLTKVVNKESVDVNEADINGSPALRWAAQFPPKFAKLLIGAGADVNQKGQGGITPLHEAARNGMEKVVKLLLDNNADPNLEADNRETPLEHLKNNFTGDQATKDRIAKLLKAKMS